ncbi:hypothetical protein CAL7716_102380 (plasmid) [Calothrix sp. PCC 7716]|nr:hypothetical protein CAL7716_102380 [Calothrix sp. PCC 7716]
MDIKKIETRPRGVRCPLPTQLIIHCSSQKPDAATQALADKYLGENFKPKYGHAIGICTLTGTTKMTPDYIASQTAQEIEVGIWEEGRVAWHVTDKIIFNIPIKVPGKQAAPWKPSDNLIQRVNQELSFLNQDSSSFKVEKALHHDSYVIVWKNEPVGNYDPNEDPINKVDELRAHCLHIESIGLKPCLRNCSIYWNKYEILEGFTVESGFPWIVDDYFNNNREWRQIDEQHWQWYQDKPCIETKKDAFLISEVRTYNNSNEDVYVACCQKKGKYYAQLMTLKEFNSMEVK